MAGALRTASALALLVAASPAAGAGCALAFGGTGSGDVDRLTVRVDDPADALPGPPIDVGAGDFTIEFRIKRRRASTPRRLRDNAAPAPGWRNW